MSVDNLTKEKNYNDRITSSIDEISMLLTQIKCIARDISGLSVPEPTPETSSANNIAEVYIERLQYITYMILDIKENLRRFIGE